MIFELCLMTNQAWVLAHTGLSHPKPFYLKRFNDGAIEGSGPYEFLKKLVEDHPEGGEVEFSFADKSESIPKAIQRIGLRGLARDLFFGPSRGNKVIFHGVRIALPRDQKCRNLLTELEDMHKKAGAPEYNICLL